MQKVLKDLGIQSTFHYTSGLRSLIELGRQGFFPLFSSEWIDQSFSKRKKRASGFKVTEKQREVLNHLLMRLSLHKQMDRKKTVLDTLSDKDRKLFIKTFFHLVEHAILENEQEFH